MADKLNVRLLRNTFLIIHELALLYGFEAWDDDNLKSTYWEQGFFCNANVSQIGKRCKDSCFTHYIKYLAPNYKTKPMDTY